MTDFSTLIPTAQKFYAKLNKDNTKTWWTENRSTYDRVLKPGAQDLLAEIAPELSDLSDCEVTTKLFRPHRDVRFSKDKTPYNTHLHMMWHLTTDGPQAPVYFFGIGLDYVTVGAGVMGFEKPVQENWRKFLDLDTDRILATFKTLTDAGMTFREPELKRVPSPYAADHPAAEHLRRKGMIATTDIGASDDLPKAILDACKALSPLNDLLVQISES